MRRDLIPYPIAETRVSYGPIQERICEETHIAGGAVVYREFLFMNKENHPEMRRVVVEGFRKTFWVQNTMVRIPSASERERIEEGDEKFPGLLKKLNINTALPPIERVRYADGLI